MKPHWIEKSVGWGFIVGSGISRKSVNRIFYNELLTEKVKENQQKNI